MRRTVVRTITVFLFILVLYCKLMMPIKNKGMFLFICICSFYLCFSLQIKLYKKCSITTAIFPVCAYTLISIINSSYNELALFILSQTLTLGLLYFFALYVLKYGKAKKSFINAIIFTSHLFILEMLIIIMILIITGRNT